MNDFSVTIECPQCKQGVSVPSTSIFNQKVTRYNEVGARASVFVYLCPTCDKGRDLPSVFNSKIIPASMLTDEQQAEIIEHRYIHVGLE